MVERFYLAMINDVHSDLTIFDFDKLQPLPFQDSLVTLGNFDGVHLGHQAIISRLVEKAQLTQQPVIVVTFYPNPSVYFKRREKPYYLLTPNRKEELLLELGVDAVVTFRFNGEFASLTPEEFLIGLKANLGMSSLVVGHDFALGKNRQGTIPVIREIGKKLSFDLEIIKPIIVGELDVSSTLIRQSLGKGDVRTAADMLGRPYSIAGEVSHGSDRGSRIGLPTANLFHWDGKKLPAVGVYATLIELNGQMHYGITNVGFRPTFESQSDVNIETHILDFDGNIYGEKMSVAFIQKIRDEIKFSGVDALLQQIEQDKISAREIFHHDQI